MTPVNAIMVGEGLIKTLYSLGKCLYSAEIVPIVPSNLIAGVIAEPPEERLLRGVHPRRGHHVLQHRAEVSLPRRPVLQVLKSKFEFAPNFRALIAASGTKTIKLFLSSLIRIGSY